MPSGWPTSLQMVKDLDRTSCSIKSEESTSTDELDDDQNNDGEGVWSPDIEQSFHVSFIEKTKKMKTFNFYFLRKHWRFILHVDDEKSFYLTKEKCSEEMN